jgi:hypothetical protein
MTGNVENKALRLSDAELIHQMVLIVRDNSALRMRILKNLKCDYSSCEEYDDLTLRFDCLDKMTVVNHDKQ